MQMSDAEQRQSRNLSGFARASTTVDRRRLLLCAMQLAACRALYAVRYELAQSKGAVDEGRDVDPEHVIREGW